MTKTKDEQEIAEGVQAMARALEDERRSVRTPTPRDAPRACLRCRAPFDPDVPSWSNPHRSARSPHEPSVHASVEFCLRVLGDLVSEFEGGPLAPTRRGGPSPRLVLVSADRWPLADR